MRYFIALSLLVLVFAGCRQAPQTEAGPGEKKIEQPEKESPIPRGKDSLDPVMADMPETKEVDTLYRNFGRSLKRGGGSIELIGSASSVRFRASGDTVKLNLEVPGKDHSYVLITLDDKFSWKYKLSGGNKVSLAIPLTKGQLWEEIGVFKLTEAVNGPVLFHGATASGLSRSDYDPEILIEFIGNSMTCGYGVDQEQVPCGTGSNYDQHNPYESFAAKAARTMGAGYSLSAVSGAGVYRNYGEKDTLTIPQRYGDIYMSGPGGSDWPPEGWDPDIVSICLGTNDVGAVRDGTKAAFDQNEFTGRYIDFIQELRSVYPRAAFVLVGSPMLSGADAELLQASLEEVRDHFDDDLVIGVLQFRNIGRLGCEGHPGLQDQDQMSRQLRSFLIKTLDDVAEKEGLVIS